MTGSPLKDATSQTESLRQRNDCRTAILGTPRLDASHTGCPFGLCAHVADLGRAVRYGRARDVAPARSQPGIGTSLLDGAQLASRDAVRVLLQSLPLRPRHNISSLESRMPSFAAERLPSFLITTALRTAWRNSWWPQSPKMHPMWRKPTKSHATAEVSSRACCPWLGSRCSLISEIRLLHMAASNDLPGEAFISSCVDC